MVTEAEVTINGKKLKFYLIEDGKDQIKLKCNQWSVLKIYPKGIMRYTSIGEGMFKLDADGKIAMRTEHTGMREYKCTGTKDVALKLEPKSTELYISAINSDGEKMTLLYIDCNGLYLWIATGYHEKNCYATAKSDTILLVD